MVLAVARRMARQLEEESAAKGLALAVPSPIVPEIKTAAIPVSRKLVWRRFCLKALCWTPNTFF